MDLARTPPNKQLQPIDLVAPGFLGVNMVQSGALLSPQYATLALNTVIDSSGRLAARLGVSNLTTTPIASDPVVRTLFEYFKIDGTVAPIVAWNGGISTSLTDPSGSDISGAVTDADGTWKFVNFNNKCIGFQAGQKCIVYTGAGNFATVVESSGTAPSGGVGTAAFGRIWQLDTDKQTIKYSGLLNETQWSSGGAGTIDMRNIWTAGTDVVTAIEAFNGSLLIFGLKHIVIFSDGVGSALGIDPTNLAVTDVITGTGCVSQFTVQPVGETDLLFLSPNGVQSIQRLVQERSPPVSNLTKYVRDVLLVELQEETTSLIRSLYNPLTGFYLLSLPASSTTWVLDQRRRYRDADGDDCAIITHWSIAPTALLSRQDNTILMARTGGRVGQYAGYADEDDSYSYSFQSPWLNLGEDFANRLKILKRIGALLFVRTQTSVTFKWSVDFSDNFSALQQDVVGDASAEWGTGEFGESEFSGGLALRILKVPARGRGQYFRIGLEATISGEFAVQQAELFTKMGRLA